MAVLLTKVGERRSALTARGRPSVLEPHPLTGFLADPAFDDIVHEPGRGLDVDLAARSRATLPISLAVLQLEFEGITARGSIFGQSDPTRDMKMIAGGCALSGVALKHQVVGFRKELGRG